MSKLAKRLEGVIEPLYPELKQPLHTATEVSIDTSNKNIRKNLALTISKYILDCKPKEIPKCCLCFEAALNEWQDNLEGGK